MDAICRIRRYYVSTCYTTKDNIFALHYNVLSEASEESIQLDIEALIDPDDDGNHPITIGDKLYLVIGRVV